MPASQTAMRACAYDLQAKFCIIMQSIKSELCRYITVAGYVFDMHDDYMRIATYCYSALYTYIGHNTQLSIFGHFTTILKLN